MQPLNREIVHLDLFSGAGGFAEGFRRAGYTIKRHYFSEIDKHAIANYRYNFKEAEYVGSVTDVRGRELPERPNLITFGSPCQDFSLAGKRRGLEGSRSSLIEHAIRLITECRPDVFIWENVKGTFSSNAGADFWAIIQAFANIGGYRIEWQLLNTAWLLPQNRERIYLIGHLGTRGGRNVFPFGEDDSVFAAQRTGGSNEPLPCITATEHKGPSKQRPQNLILQVRSATTSGFETAMEGDSINLSQPNSETRRGRVGHGVAQTLETSCQQAVIMPGRQTTMNSQRVKPVGEPAFTINCAQDTGVATNGRIRRLTETECERLQGFDTSWRDGSEPRNWTKWGIYDPYRPDEVKEISRTQRYKLMGNAVTVDVVQAIAERL